MNITVTTNITRTQNSTNEVSQHTKRKPIYGEKFVTLKWIKKGEVKDWDFYLSIIRAFKPYGRVSKIVLGPDGINRPHVHFKFQQNAYFKYKNLIPKYCHINYIPYKPYHDKYISNHKLL